MIKIGAHVSAAVSLELSFERALHIGAECIQIFVSPPQQWLQTKHDKAEIKRYLEAQGKSAIGPNFIHGTYLINLAAQDPEHLKKSISWLVYAMDLARELGIDGVIFHLGSHKGVGFDQVINQIIKALKEVLSKTAATEGSSKPYLILENSAGAGGNIGSKFSELGEILRQAQENRLKICLDTQHSFAAGYDLSKKASLDKAMEEFDGEVGLKNLVAVHCNDSKVEFGAGKDKHENIGEGFIGRQGFKNIINHPAFKDMPFILEVPGFTQTGPDRDNIDILKKLLHT